MNNVAEHQLGEEFIAVFWETVCELIHLLPEGWTVTHSSLFGCVSNYSSRCLAGTFGMVKCISFDLEYIDTILHLDRKPVKGTFKYKLWKFLTKFVLAELIRHEFRHANQFQYLGQHGVPWYAALLAESHTPYMDQIMEKDARQFQYFGIARSLDKAMAPIIKMVRG